MTVPGQHNTTAREGTLLSALSKALVAMGQGNSSVGVGVAAILWPDKDRQWLPVLPVLQRLLPQLLTLGEYDPEKRSGPAIWLKCAMAQQLAEVSFSEAPIIYLAGVSRAELRAIESCPRELQPLAELQYRGVFWSQANAKDWTLNAFLSAEKGGLGLEVAQDKATQEALVLAFQSGVLLDKPLIELQGRTLNADWLMGLMAPNPLRDVLAWMNDATAMQQQWAGPRWQVFSKRLKKDYGIDPMGDGVFTAAERLAKRAGAWQAVAELYEDAHSNFPNVLPLLKRVQPTQTDLLTDWREFAGYPQVNEQHEGQLRYALHALGAMQPAAARERVMNLEQEHGQRRRWLWSRMGQAPLAAALGALVRVAQGTQQLPVGNTPAALAQHYAQNDWAVDEAALSALAAVATNEDLAAVSEALRALYSPWLHACAERLQNAVRSAGSLGDLPDPSASAQGTCTVFIDGLRYDVAQRLKARLSTLGEVSLSAHWTSLPSVTASGKAWCSPIKAQISGQADNTDFEPCVAADGKPLTSHHFRRVLAEQRVEVLDKHAVGDPTGQAWVEVGDLDHYGHEHGIRLARDIDTQLALIVERIEALVRAGWPRVRVVTDHGWLLLPGGLPKSELAKHQTETRWGRCAVLKASAHATDLTLPWSWCQEVQIAYAPGISSFVAGAEYAHGGISVQECLVPVIELQVTQALQASQTVTITQAVWKGLRCVIEVAEELPDLQVDIRTKPALASSSVLTQPKALVAGKANVAVADDELAGSAAVIVILDAQGQVLQRLATTIGG